MTPTLRGAALMTLAMGLFAAEDALIKGLSGAFSAAQIIWMLGLGGTLAFAAWMAASGRGVWSPVYLQRAVLRRSVFEVIGALCFVSALALIPLSLASAVIQATPLVVALGAALFLGARVGWRRWLAILVGFGGVLLILRPGSDSFDPATLLAVGGMLSLAVRDLATRTIPGTVSGARLSIHAFAALIPAGLILQAVLGIPVATPNAAQLGILALCVGIGMAAYLAVVSAMRAGDIAVVSSFRYTRMLFALLIAFAFFNERPDAATLVGVAIVIASGVFTLVREARLARAASKARRAKLDAAANEP